MKRFGLQNVKRVFAPRSLRVQLLSRSLFILAALLLLIGLFQYLFMQQFIYRNKASSIQSQVMSMPREVWNQDFSRKDGSGAGPGFGRSTPFLSESTLVFVDMNGNSTLVYKSPENISVPRLPDEEYTEALKKTGTLNYKLIRDDQGLDQLVVLQPVGNRVRLTGIAQVSTSTEPLKEVLLRQLITFLSLSMFALIAGLLTFLPVLKRTLVPLSSMVDTVGQIDAGNLAERLPARQGQLEIDRLSLSFNGMLERLEASFEAEKEAKEKMRRFVADASHELRTPLTSIHGFLEVLLRGAANQPEQLARALRSMYGESERINKLVNDLLLLARLDREPSVHLTEGMLGEVVHEMEPQLRLLAGNRQVSFSLDQEQRCRFDRDKIKQVILNLFHNAVQHTDPVHGHIRFTLRSLSQGVEIIIQDNGPGIPKEHLPYVFDRFYRIDSSRVRKQKQGGAGLGLAISKSIVDIHGGTIEVDSREGEGCTFRVRLP